MNTSQEFLSVIIPVYKQQKTIKADLTNILHSLGKTRFAFELICVVDGMVDQSFQQAKKLKSAKLTVLGYKSNHGKGYALRYGMAKARGNYIAFIDSGMEIDPNGISMVMEHLLWYEADIIVASKRHPASIVNYPVQRKIISALYQMFVRMFTGINVRDTQAGLKIFKRQVLTAVLPRLLVKHYAIDLELLAVAHKLGFTRIFEAPVKLTYHFSDLTHAHTLQSMYKILLDTCAIIYRLRVLHYYADKNKRLWKFDPELNFRINTG